MKNPKYMLALFLAAVVACNKQGTPVAANGRTQYLFVDVHNIGPGKVKFADVAGAHQKDLATQSEFDVHFKKYWVDESLGKVYCLAEASDSASVSLTHKKAHGLVPERVMKVTDGAEAKELDGVAMYFDIHRFKPNSVTAADVAGAHVKDLAVQKKFNVSFINYWVDPSAGIVMCLANAPDSAAMVNTHKMAHGLIPDEVHSVKEGK